PALLMGLAFPLANAIIQRAERPVGRRAGILYLSNTVGAVCGSLAAGFLLLPVLGIQGSATILTTAAALAVGPLYLATDAGRALLGPSSSAASNKTRPTYPLAFAVSILVAGGAFGLGHPTQAATLHPSGRRVEVVDLSRHVLTHAGYFMHSNGDVLNDRRVAVYVNDGRQHLQMQRPGSYDLITLEPPPIAQAGVAALYSEEFYALAKTRLK